MNKDARQVAELHRQAREAAKRGDKVFEVQRIEWYRLMNSDLANPRSGGNYVVDPDEQTICGIELKVLR